MTADNPEGEPAPDAAPKRGRTPGFHMTEEHRSKIRNSQILNRLISCALGEVTMDPTQASVGMGLIRKYLPDLQTTTHQGDEEGGPLFPDTIKLIAGDGSDDKSPA